uniref:Extracellular matrix protein 1 n=1 Tax=Nothobranchius kuhntae TaxID=321403 RepID=A0A1A8HZG4_NOTKU
MTSAPGLMGFWITALIILVATVEEAQMNKVKTPDILFPPACPKMTNLKNICELGQYRPRYPDKSLPLTGYSDLRRRANAINRLESWYDICCHEQNAPPDSQILCCAEQAWKQALSQFCVEEYSTMSAVYECCEYKNVARWTCFDSDLPNPDYDKKPDYIAPNMPREPGFTFDSDAC